MALLKLKPAVKDYIWGGSRLSEEYGKAEKGRKIAETWELSCYPGSESIIENGKYAGETLTGYIEHEGRSVIGRKGEEHENFPILIKLIDALDDLSIQVHPDDAFARTNGNGSGKNEMWYILDAEPGAYIYYGLKQEIDEQELRERIADNTVLEVLNKVEVHPGDVYFIEAGTIHSIGRGILTAEIQQNSDITYRIYDYGRIGKDGKERELHIDEAMKVVHLKPVARLRDNPGHLCSSDFFTVDRLDIDGEKELLVGDDSFIHILCLSGSGQAVCGKECLEFKKGDSLFIPAGSGRVAINGKAEALVTYL